MKIVASQDAQMYMGNPSSLLGILGFNRIEVKMKFRKHVFLFFFLSTKVNC